MLTTTRTSSRTKSFLLLSSGSGTSATSTTTTTSTNGLFLTLLLLALLITCSSLSDDSSTSGVLVGNDHLAPAAAHEKVISCHLVASVDEDTEEIEYKCEHEELIYPIENHSSDFQELLQRPNRLYSGIELDIQGAYISDDGRYFVIPSDAEIGFATVARTKAQVEAARAGHQTSTSSSSTASRHRHGRQRRLYRDEFGTRTFLVVYVRDASGDKPDKNPSGFPNSIEDDVFGTFGDALNLANVVSSDVIHSPSYNTTTMKPHLSLIVKKTQVLPVSERSVFFATYHISQNIPCLVLVVVVIHNTFCHSMNLVPMVPWILFPLLEKPPPM
jgi:hypothetical protein